jgi:hypothetical protein
MLIKNAIVLVDQIDVEIREGKPRYQAVRRRGQPRAFSWGRHRVSAPPLVSTRSSAAWR